MTSVGRCRDTLIFMMECRPHLLDGFTLSKDFSVMLVCRWEVSVSFFMLQLMEC